MRAKVSLVQGKDRYTNIHRALELIGDSIALERVQRVVIKPNFVSTRQQLATTHVEAVRAVLDFVRARYTGRIAVAEGSALDSTWEGFRRFGYKELAMRYDIELVDLNADVGVCVQALTRQLRPQELHLASSVVESDFRISVGPPKTHDAVIVTLALKNMIMGSLLNPAVAGGQQAWRLRWVPRFVRTSRVAQMVQRHFPFVHPSDKMAMHQGYPVLNLNLAALAGWVWPHLAVIDGFQAMEGAGPLDGDAVDWRTALAGTDALAVDALTTHLMGFDPREVGYLEYCRRLGLGVGKLERIDVLGDAAIDEVRREFRPHPTYARQKEWRMERAESFLRMAPRVMARTKRGGYES
jgi:uncharacterized protein (DUF362 family)